MASAKDKKCRNHAACKSFVYRDSVTGLCASCFQEESRRSKPSAHVTADRELDRVKGENTLLKGRYAAARKEIEGLEKSLRALDVLRDTAIEPFFIEPLKKSGSITEGVVNMVASDWHVEERVDPRTVSQLNEYNLEIATERAGGFFRSGLRLIQLLQKDVTINRLVLPLLGDFISNQIHEEFAENNLLEPMHAITFARNLISSGIDFVLEHSDLEIILPCHSGNHGRTTKTVRAATENGHSLEYLMFLHLADIYANRKESRVKFLIAEGYHSYLDIFGTNVRYHHGHEVNYQGGVGGLYIPVGKAINDWNKAKRADLDVFGHFHTGRDGGNFISNGSLIGYNAWALRRKFAFEKPRQQLFLIDNKRGRTCTWPILFKR